jgi:hypothetical protein
MKVKELIALLSTYSPEFPVCFFLGYRQEYAEIDNNGSIEKIWDENNQRWILSLNENDESIIYGLTNIK